MRKGLALFAGLLFLGTVFPALAGFTVPVNIGITALTNNTGEPANDLHVQLTGPPVEPNSALPPGIPFSWGTDFFDDMTTSDNLAFDLKVLTTGTGAAPGDNVSADWLTVAPMQDPTQVAS
jgi:hypothetical protein